jgi:uncharacterized lipoprotein YmbA
MKSVTRAAAVLIVLAIGACASAPVALVALPHPPAPQGSLPSAGATDAGAGPSVLVREVSVPAYLDGFPVVIGRRGSGLVASRDTEWAERPSTGATRVLRDALSERLGPSRVLIAGDGRIPDADLTVELLALDPQPGTLHLDARWSFSCTVGRGGRAGRTQLELPMGGATPEAVATATSDALARLADVLAATPTECRPFADDLARRGR